MKPKFRKQTVLDHGATGAEIKALRIAKGISQTKLARTLRMSQPYLCQLEDGARARWTDKLFDRVVAAIARLAKEGGK